MRQLKLSEVRFSRDGLRVIAAPLDAGRRDRRGVDALLKRRHEIAFERAKARYLQEKPALMHKPEMWPTVLMLYKQEHRVNRAQKWKPYDVILLPAQRAPTGPCIGTYVATCHTCLKRFLRNTITRVDYCSPRCMPKRKRKRKSEAKPRPTIKCAQCGESFSPKRADARTCSGKCRVALHRAA